MEDMKRRQIPAFGHWDCYDDLSITQYFESAWQAGLIRSHFWKEDADIFKVPAQEKPAYRHRKMRKGGQKQQEKGQPRKPGSVSGNNTQQTPRMPTRTSKAVDEDLYKIPPELLYQKPRRKRLLRNLLSGCLGIA